MAPSQEKLRGPSEQVVARAPRATIGIIVQAIGFVVVWGVRRPTSTQMWRRFTGPDALIAAVSATLAVGSLLLVAVAMRHLGRQWAIEARTIKDHQLITSGPYGVVRHPIYVGVGGFLVAVGLAFAPAWALGIACLAYAIGTNIRVRAEDSLMAATFGAAFEEYRRKVPALVPRL